MSSIDKTFTHTLLLYICIYDSPFFFHLFLPLCGDPIYGIEQL